MLDWDTVIKNEFYVYLIRIKCLIRFVGYVADLYPIVGRVWYSMSLPSSFRACWLGRHCRCRSGGRGACAIFLYDPRRLSSSASVHGWTKQNVSFLIIFYFYRASYTTNKVLSCHILFAFIYALLLCFYRVQASLLKWNKKFIFLNFVLKIYKKITILL